MLFLAASAICSLTKAANELRTLFSTVFFGRPRFAFVETDRDDDLEADLLCDLFEVDLDRCVSFLAVLERVFLEAPVAGVADRTREALDLPPDDGLLDGFRASDFPADFVAFAFTAAFWVDLLAEEARLAERPLGFAVALVDLVALARPRLAERVTDFPDDLRPAVFLPVLVRT